MSVLPTSFFCRTTALRQSLRSVKGISILDVVIAILVLTVVLLAAANQFGSYEKSAAPAAQEQAEASAEQ